MNRYVPRLLFACAFATAAILAVADRSAAAEPSFGDAEWIGVEAVRHARAGEGFHASKSFQVEGAIERATLRVVADNGLTSVALNDRDVAILEPFAYPQEHDVADRLKQGSNRVSIAAVGQGPTAVGLRLDIVMTDGRRQTIVSDGSWSLFDRRVVTYGPVAADHWTDLSPDVAISPFDNYEQWQQAKGTPQATDAAKFQIADGFEIELVKSAGPDEGSWISIACDPKGRFVIGREDTGLLRLTLPEPKADRSAIQVETINDTLKECRGLLFAHDSLYAIANGSEGMFRLRDQDGDDKYEQVDELFQLPGKSGHGRNGLALGPDGRVHLICGDSIELPTGVKDRTSPFTEHRRGERTKEGFVLAFDADGGNREILCTGLRNPYGIAFNEHGDSFTYDADAEFDMGSPWYRPTRVLHLAPGSDFGWRGVTGNWPPYFPDHADNAPPLLDIGKGSPTAVMFGTRSHFPPRYQQSLFILDWSYGRIVAVDLEPRGSSYSGKATTFCKGRPFNVTSLCFGADGAMYVVTGGRKTQSGLYRIRYTGKPQVGAESAPTAQQIDRRTHAAKQRERRRELEAMLTGDVRLDLTQVPVAMRSSDPKIRYVARTVIEHQPLDRWRPVRMPEFGRYERQRFDRAELWEHVGWLTARTRAGTGGAPGDPQAAFEHAMAMLKIELLSPSQREALYDVLLTHLEAQPFDKVHQAPLAVALKAELSRKPPVNPAVLVRAFAALRANVFVEVGSELLATATTQREQMLYLFALRDLPWPWQRELRTPYFQRLAEARKWQGGEGMPRFIQRITDDALASIPEAERAKYAAMVKPEAQAVDDSPLVQTRPVFRVWKTDDVPTILDASSQSKADLTRGKEMFAAALCIRCHRFGTSGRAVGPDLTGLARRFSRRDMLEHTLAPSKVIAEQYRTVQIETSDGQVVVGRVLSEGDFRSQRLRIATNPLDPRQVTEVAKSDIESHTTTSTSLMPEGLLNTLNAAEIVDLLAFLETAGVGP